MPRKCKHNLPGCTGELRMYARACQPCREFLAKQKRAQHIAKWTAIKQARRQRGVCTQCGATAAPYTTCRACRMKSAARYHKRAPTLAQRIRAAIDDERGLRLSADEVRQLQTLLRQEPQ